MKNYMITCMEYDLKAILHCMLQVLERIEVKYIDKAERSYDYELRFQCKETDLFWVGVALPSNSSVCWCKIEES